MRFTLHHDVDAPLDAVELAVVSPLLVDKLARRLPMLEEIQQVEHALRGRTLTRVWRFQANIKVPDFAAKHVTREMLAWEERTTYDLASHAATWVIVPAGNPTWGKYFQASGTYALTPRDAGRTRRTVQGELTLQVPYFRFVGERVILSEVRKTFEAEVPALTDLAAL